jgi:nucleoid-associated protein YgaU
LAYAYYKDPTLWWIIAEANNIGKGDLLVPVGKQIRIPTEITSIIEEYSALNNL